MYVQCSHANHMHKRKRQGCPSSREKKTIEPRQWQPLIAANPKSILSIQVASTPGDVVQVLPPGAAKVKWPFEYEPK